MPRISFLDSRPFNPLFHPPRQSDPVPPPPSPDDPLDARRLHLRLQAIGRVLDDLPRQARRLARWQARRDAALKGGRRRRGRRGARPSPRQQTVQGQRPSPALFANAARPSARMAPPARSRCLWRSQRASRPCRLGAGAPRHVLRGSAVRIYRAADPRARPEDMLPLR